MMTRARRTHPAAGKDKEKRDSSPIFGPLCERDLWEQMMPELDAG